MKERVIDDENQQGRGDRKSGKRSERERERMADIETERGKRESERGRARDRESWGRDVT